MPYMSTQHQRFGRRVWKKGAVEEGEKGGRTGLGGRNALFKNHPTFARHPSMVAPPDAGAVALGALWQMPELDLR
jgi:hypothetical protein